MSIGREQDAAQQEDACNSLLRGCAAGPEAAAQQSLNTRFLFDGFPFCHQNDHVAGRELQTVEMHGAHPE
jgi:hypothetical protein